MQAISTRYSARRAWLRWWRARVCCPAAPGVPGLVHVCEGLDVGEPDVGAEDAGLVGAGFLQQALDLAEDLLGWPVTLVLGLAAT